MQQIVILGLMLYLYGCSSPMPNPSCFSMSEKEMSMYIFPCLPETQGEEASDHSRRDRCYHLGSLETREEEVHWDGQALEESLLVQLRSHSPGTCFPTIQKSLDRVSPRGPMLPSPKEVILGLLLSGRF